MNVLAGIRAGACGFKAFPPDTFSGSGVGFEPCKMTIAKIPAVAKPCSADRCGGSSGSPPDSIANLRDVSKSGGRLIPV